MSEEIREFVTGDKIILTATLVHEANVAGITVSYRSENEPHASYGTLELSQGSTHVGISTFDQSVPLPSPYLNGEVTLETIVSPWQRPGIYFLESIKLLTAGHREIVVQEVPEHRIRILPEPTYSPHIDQWEVAHENQA